MKKFLLLGIMLLTMGGVINAEKKQLSFKTDWYTNVSWSNSTMTWPKDLNGNLDWVFIEVSNFGKDKEENITGYAKLVITLSEFQNASTAQVAFQDQHGNGNPGSGKYARVELKSGKNVIDLTTLDKGDCDFEKIQDITIYGGARTDGSAQASMKIVEAYFEKPDAATHDVYSLGTPITFEQALASTEPFVLVQNGKVFCGPLSASDGSLTYADPSALDDYSWTIKFEKDTEKDAYFMNLCDMNGSSKGYVNASVWSHTYLSGVNKNTTKGEQQDGALWTITATNNGKYTIKNLGVTEGNYNDKPDGDNGDRAAKGQGFLGITTSGYWANHVTIYNTSGEWEFYSLSSTALTSNDPLYFGWDKLTVSNDPSVTKDDDNHLVVDNRGYAPYWAESAKWSFDTPFDATDYRYLVFYAKRNVTKFGNGDNETGGTFFIKDAAGVTFRQDDLNKYNDRDYPKDHVGSLWMNRWNAQRATVLDLQWLANTDKYGDGSECKVLDITKIKEIGVGGSFTIGGIFFTNTLPSYSAGDYKRSFDSFEKFGTICLPYSAVCCGAQLYQITGKTDTGITLAEYEGVMEAGKPYLYKSLEAKKGDMKDEDAVYFFKAGYAKEKVAGTNNGLIGSFTKGTVPQGDNYYVVGRASGETEDKIFRVNSDVELPANRAYIDKSLIETKTASARTILVNFDGVENEATAIKSTEAAEVVTDAVFYDMSGREVKNLTPGIYIVKYGNKAKKVMIK